MTRAVVHQQLTEARPVRTTQTARLAVRFDAAASVGILVEDPLQEGTPRMKQVFRRVIDRRGRVSIRELPEPHVGPTRCSSTAGTR